ncbi:mycofactocin system glycosyltransferase [Naumannella cuiyingiana]|uniref:Mycofactocin system glycosyltransferase n=1 Tax=Naumannella cuiyingiana TaxID=1347891 RepID=A0A7Z0IJP1_9ACTN|nr:mycofactocin system glycosyltransferase [Naumannella cuiyingiana]
MTGPPRSPEPASPLPSGWRLRVDRDTRAIGERTLRGGTPARGLTLSAAGARAWRALAAGAPTDSRTAGLARRLTDAGLAHPVPPAAAVVPDVTVLIPAWNRPEPLAACLAALPPGRRVLVVDDGSDDPGVGAVVRRGGAELLRLPRNRGPAAARNAGLARIDTELVALLDSDCRGAAWIDALAPHFADPTLAAVAPRVRGDRAGAVSALDLGDRPAPVRPGSRVPWVPSAALLVRRGAVLGAGGFDERLRVGEDVDLVWRLVEAGWRVRYEPGAEVTHAEPVGARAILVRRYRYGTSAAPLAARHPAAYTPLDLHPGHALAAAALLARRPGMAALGQAAVTLRLARRFAAAGLPARGAAPEALRGSWLTLRALGRAGVQLAPAALLAGLLARRTRPAAALLLGAALTATRPPRALGLAEEIAYGAGVWAGALRARDPRALLPRVRLGGASTPPADRRTTSKEGSHR